MDLVHPLQRWGNTNVTLVFEDAQVIPYFSKEKTDNTFDTDDTDDTNATDDTDDTDETDQTDDTDDTGTGWNRLE